jgi:hypothetical protein
MVSIQLLDTLVVHIRRQEATHKESLTHRHSTLLDSTLPVSKAILSKVIELTLCLVFAIG